MSNSNPGLAYGQVPTATQWNSYFTAKQDWNAILDAIIAAGGAPTVTAPTTWTPTDASGASLTLVNDGSTYTKLGNIVFASSELVYPSTASGANAVIGGLPVAVPPQFYAKTPALVFSTAGVGILAQPIPSSSTFALFNLITGAAITNATLSGKKIDFQLIYPAS